MFKSRRHVYKVKICAFSMCRWHYLKIAFIFRNYAKFTVEWYLSYILAILGIKQLGGFFFTTVLSKRRKTSFNINKTLIDFALLKKIQIILQIEVLVKWWYFKTQLIFINLAHFGNFQYFYSSKLFYTYNNLDYHIIILDKKKKNYIA